MDKPVITARVLKIACSGCGASLDIAPGQEHFVCDYCGASLIIERRGGTIACTWLPMRSPRCRLESTRRRPSQATTSSARWEFSKAEQENRYT